MYPTKNDLPQTVRNPMIALLNARLADSVDLMQQAKQAHWNVKGPSFFSLHQLFDQLADDVEEYVDSFAERVVQLGGIALGTVRVAAVTTTLAEYPLHAATGKDHVDALSSALARLGAAVRAAIKSADSAGDVDSADLFTEASRSIDKWLWLLEAHLQEPT